MTSGIEFSASELSAEIDQWIMCWRRLPQKVAETKSRVLNWLSQRQRSTEVSAANTLLALLHDVEEEIREGTLRPSKIIHVTSRLLQIELEAKKSEVTEFAEMIASQAHAVMNVTIALDPQRLAHPLAQNGGLPSDLLQPIANVLLDLVDLDALTRLAEQLNAAEKGTSQQQHLQAITETIDGDWTIVAVEDAPEWRLLIEQVVNRVRETLTAGTQIQLQQFTNVTSAKRALEQVEHERTLLVLDLELPLQEGTLPTLDAGRQLSQYAREDRNIPVIILTAPHNSLDDHLLAFGLGVSDYCLKGQDDRPLLTGALIRKMARRSKRTIWLSTDGSREIQIDGYVVVLDPQPFEVLRALARSYFRTLDTLGVQDVLEQSYGRDVRVADVISKIKTQISDSFRKMGQTISPGDEILETISRWGPNVPRVDRDRNNAYRLVADVVQNKSAPRRAVNRVLLVEDEEVWLRPVEQLLRNHGYEVETATSLTEAIEMAASFSPHLVCLDLCIPEQPAMIPSTEHGLALLKRLSESFPDLKCVMLTATAEIDICRDQTVRLGVRPEDFIPKSIDLPTIANRLVVHLRRAELELQQRVIQSLPQVAYVPFLRLEVGAKRDRTLVTVHALGRSLPLPDQDGTLLLVLAKRACHAVSKEELWSHLWPIDTNGSSVEELDETNGLKKAIQRLRKHITDWLPADVLKTHKNLTKLILANDGKNGYILNARVEFISDHDG